MGLKQICAHVDCNQTVTFVRILGNRAALVNRQKFCYQSESHGDVWWCARVYMQWGGFVPIIPQIFNTNYGVTLIKSRINFTY